MTLAADVRVRRGSFTLEVSLAADDGSVVALLGPNGSGKTTLLRALAGLQPMTGRLQVDGVDNATLPPQRRRVGWVPQDAALFPHLTVAGNVAFGIGGRAAHDDARSWLDALEIGDLADRKARTLSGGQAQKVALARALARRPRILLLDEPLAALDATARSDVRRTLRRHLAAFDGVTILVTHDPVDAMSLADRAVALEQGTLVQDAAPSEIAVAPRTPWLAGLMGVNAFPGRLDGATLRIDGGGELTVADPASGPVDALAVVAPHAVTLHPEQPIGSARNAWPVRVAELTSLGARVRIRCEGAPPVMAEVTATSVDRLGLTEDAEVWASVKATEVTVVLL